MILAAVVCPHPPLLLRELSGAEDALPDLRQACRDALLEAFAAGPGAVVVVGGADVAREWDPDLPVDVRRFGTSDPARVTGRHDRGAGRAHGRTDEGADPVGPGLPLSLGVAKRLLGESGWDGPLRLLSVPWDADAGVLAGVARNVSGAGDGETSVVLLVMGDGSNCRGEKAPGYLDERSFAYDSAIVDALEQGDAGGLAGLDADLGAELGVAGRAAFGVLGETVKAQGTSPRARVLYADDPFGVQYTVALWGLRGRG